MDLVDKFNFAVTSLSSGSTAKLKQEEMVFYCSSYSSESAPGSAVGFSVADPIFKDIVDTLENHFQAICAPMANRVEFNMVNHFLRGIEYKEVYGDVLKNFKRILGDFLSTYKKGGEIVINLTSNQIEITLQDLILKPQADEKAIYYKIKNNRFYNVEARSSRRGRAKLYEFCLTESWDNLKKNEEIFTTSIKNDKRKGRWEIDL